jgi:hypothetical protein
MIINLPDSDTLTETALRLYFSAWNRLLAILDDWDTRIPGASLARSVPELWKEEAEWYLDDCQNDLQAAIAVIQQSNELALKARLCVVSPYLLLDGQIPLSADPKQIDFFGLRTLDAQKLPHAVNTLCAAPLPASYVTRYEYLRRVRNRYTHLGHAGARLHPVEMLRSLLDQFSELWPDRGWLHDRVRVAGHDRAAGFGDKFWNPTYGVFQMWPGDTALMPPAKFKRLFGIDRKAVRYLCHGCRKEAETREGLTGVTVATAYLIEGGASVRCLACLRDTKLGRERCERPGCASEAMGVGEHDGLCHQCGHERGSAEGDAE